MKTIRIRLYDEIGPFCVDPDEAHALQKRLQRLLVQYEQITVSLDGVKAVTPGFLQVAFDFPGQLRRFRFTSLDDWKKHLLDQALPKRQETDPYRG